MSEEKTKSVYRGEEAQWPHHIPLKGWIDIGKRVWHEMKVDHVQIVSAGVAFYFFLSIFPTIVAAISIYSLVLEPSQIQDQISRLNLILPEKAFGMISDILNPVIQQTRKEIGWGLVVSILISIWSANKGTNALFQGVNIAYDEIESRNIFKKNLITLLFTLCGLVLGLISLLIVIFFPLLIDKIGFTKEIEDVLTWFRWVILGLILISTLSMVYKIAPNRRSPRFRWVSWGAFLGTGLWLAGSMAFSWYVSNFGSYDDLYGSFAAVAILMLWLFLTAFIVLMGAEINSEMEHQTRYDTTIGAEKPMGERNAWHADHCAVDESKD
ncbi:YihY/virulence factor BrkB family protein [Christiangramia sp. SM2212]|uniref:YihY/virulence factor BrkB family protein n=1 Tax=Christiangramia sediminicola TaxID=3073267 RepID=A0ABU1EM68_9FLAO|nr:YihY/virulence factor BrkB family protein [Christiangramia sp. SM2212]MDR5589477.1 YihY/virulence factor BrkB family protein [Christiangramia sp. SM2212]